MYLSPAWERHSHAWDPLINLWRLQLTLREPLNKGQSPHPSAPVVSPEPEPLDTIFVPFLLRGDRETWERVRQGLLP